MLFKKLRETFPGDYLEKTGPVNESFTCGVYSVPAMLVEMLRSQKGCFINT